LEGLCFFTALSGALDFPENLKQNNSLKFTSILKSFSFFMYNRNIRGSKENNNKQERLHMLIAMKSMFTGKINTLDIPIQPEEYSNYINNKRSIMIQEAFPNLSAPLREFLLTGVTPEEWADVFGRPDTTQEDIADDNPLDFEF
jgi:hypothetical protein